MSTSPPAAPSDAPHLVRGLGLRQATALNISNMVGIGPFITIPAFISAMHGPQALVAWVAAAALVFCDGLVWSELGAALPGSGGSYHFLREVFGRWRWGRLLPFLFIWQFLVSGALELASGYIGGVNYLAYVYPSLKQYPGPFGTLAAQWLAAGGALLVTLLLCQHIRGIGRWTILLTAGTVATVALVTVSGLANFNRELLTLPPGAFQADATFAKGLGAAMLIAVYDYLGYYNVCHLGDEVREPGRTIPRAVMISVVAIAIVYLTMNLSIIAVVPWQQAMLSEHVASDFIETLFGRAAANWFTLLILWTVLACVFVMTLGYSRIAYAAARQGDFFRIFAYVHPRQHYPLVSLAVVGGLTAVCCFLSLGDVIEAAVTVRIGVQFLGQIAALHVLRSTRPDVRLPFRMWLYPIPSLLATAGWVFVLAMSKPKVLQLSAAVLVTGAAAFVLREWYLSRRDRRPHGPES